MFLPTKVLLCLFYITFIENYRLYYCTSNKNQIFVIYRNIFTSVVSKEFVALELEALNIQAAYNQRTYRNSRTLCSLVSSFLERREMLLEKNEQLRQGCPVFAQVKATNFSRTVFVGAALLLFCGVTQAGEDYTEHGYCQGLLYSSCLHTAGCYYNTKKHQCEAFPPFAKEFDCLAKKQKEKSENYKQKCVYEHSVKSYYPNCHHEFGKIDCKTKAKT